LGCGQFLIIAFGEIIMKKIFLKSLCVLAFASTSSFSSTLMEQLNETFDEIGGSIGVKLVLKASQDSANFSDEGQFMGYVKQSLSYTVDHLSQEDISFERKQEIATGLNKYAKEALGLALNGDTDSLNVAFYKEVQSAYLHLSDDLLSIPASKTE
jgi:hypothetical protein